jgi:antitoxin (DNA-binding transcriptional repressor) of toxin-antitoxin stability system
MDNARGASEPSDRQRLLLDLADQPNGPRSGPYKATAARNLSGLLSRAADRGANFNLTRGGRRIARLVPAAPSREVRVSDLIALFARLWSLGDDAETFARDVEAIRRALSNE